MRAVRLFAQIAAMLSIGAVLVACASHLTYVDDADPRTLVEVEEFASSYDGSDWAKVPAENGSTLRSEALSDMRAIGGEAAVLADLLTDGFSASRGVPVYVEATSVDGRDAWVLIEVYGPDGGTLDRTRLWVLARPDGAILSSAAYR